MIITSVAILFAFAAPSIGTAAEPLGAEVCQAFDELDGSISSLSAEELKERLAKSEGVPSSDEVAAKKIAAGIGLSSATYDFMLSKDENEFEQNLIGFSVVATIAKYHPEVAISDKDEREEAIEFYIDTLASLRARCSGA